MKKARILMVEDERAVLADNVEYLAGKGYDVVAAETLEQARFLLEEHAPDLILLDVMMPDGSGFDLCAEIRGKTKAPILFLTAMNEDESHLRGLRAGGDDYIKKPCNLDILAETIRLRLRDAGFETNRCINMPPLVVDPDSDTVTLAGEKISLTRKETQLLCLIAKAEGQRVACDKIYESVWGDVCESAAMTHTVAVHISNIRKKLHMDGNGFFEIRSTKKKEYIFSQTKFV
jgi:DNA-binding response OmpR family regulator